MPANRIVRVNEILKREIAEILYRVMNDKDFDISAVTVTRVETSSDLRRARVMCSIRGDTDTQHELLNMIKRHRKDIQHRVSRDVILKYTPYLTFQLDGSVEKGDHVLQIISELEAEEDVHRPGHDEA